MDNGLPRRTVTTKKISRTNSSETTAPKEFPEKLNGYNITNNLDKIKSLLSNPILTITSSTSSITSNYYNLFLDEYQKNIGDLKFQLFEDYSQYFIDTNFEFKRKCFKATHKES